MADNVSKFFNISNNAKYFYCKKEIVEKYDKFRFVDNEKIVKSIKEFLHNLEIKNQNIVIFEGGVGTGNFSLPLINFFLKEKINFFFIGVDISFFMLQKFYKKIKTMLKGDFEIAKKISLIFGDLERIFLPNESVDIFVLSLTLHYLNDPKKFLIESYKILKKGGILIIFLRVDDVMKIMANPVYRRPNNKSDFNIKNFWKLYNYLRFRKGGDFLPNREFVYNVSLLKKILSNNFFLKEVKVIEIETNLRIIDYINIIEKGIWSTVSLNLSKNERKELLRQLKKELREINVDLNMLLKENKKFKLLAFIKK